MKTTNNATIFEQIKTRGYMEEREMLLILSRSNEAQKDLFGYDEFSDHITLSKEWSNNELQWLKSRIKKNGETKAGQKLTHKEIEIIKNATIFDLSFVCFYYAGYGWNRHFLPVYNVAGMEYFVADGIIKVIG